ncbi:MAG: hypothetical protein HY261_01385 [Chloroflexi bacterium]|nr:hypothetical protein [Chloroflexota bacterium]
MPTISLVTEAFRGLSQATAKGKRMPELPVIVLPKLYDQLPEAEIRADVRDRVQDILSALRPKAASPAPMGIRAPSPSEMERGRKTDAK